MVASQGIQTVIRLADRTGYQVERLDAAWLHAMPLVLGPTQTIQIEGTDISFQTERPALARAVIQGFFNAASVGFTFVPAIRFSEEFGRTLESNYPEAGPAFMKFASTYWTLKILLRDFEFQSDQFPSNNADMLLLQLERFVGPLFFPMPGPAVANPNVRETIQRRLLTQYGPGVDQQDFIANNPILLRDRLSTRRGCALTLLMFTGLLSVGGTLWGCAPL